jgi:hypothetical protein
MKGEASHKSTWKYCKLCGNEMLAYTATICRECQLRMQQKATNEEYERQVEKGGTAEL